MVVFPVHAHPPAALPRLIYRLCLCFLVIGSLWPAAASAQDAGTKADSAAIETVAHADLAAQVYPEGILAVVGAYRRWVQSRDRELGVPSSYYQAGFSVGTSPGYGRASVHAEWLPAIFVKFRLQYDVYRYYGENSALLSFPSADSPFGKHEVDARQGTEETGYGTRFLIRPTIFAKAGPVIISNQTDLAYFRFDGTGPYYLEWTYEMLLKDGDRVIENRTNVLWEAWKGIGAASLRTGPYYEITHAAAADLTRQRIGIMAYWVPGETYRSFQRPRLFAQAGWYVRDPNREHEFTGAAGVGIDYDW